jgi:hypothetical protein
VLLPRFTNGVEVSVNGVVILDSRAIPPPTGPPQHARDRRYPASLLRHGENDLAIRLSLWGPISVFLDRVFVGPDEALRPSYDARTLLFVTLPVRLAAVAAHIRLADLCATSISAIEPEPAGADGLSFGRRRTLRP